MGIKVPLTTNKPHWWPYAHALTVIYLGAAIVAAAMSSTALLWGIGTAIAACATGILRWQMGAIDAQTGRGQILLRSQRLLVVAGCLCGLTAIHPLFAGTFVALPLILSALVPKEQRRAWSWAAASTSLLLLGNVLAYPMIVAICAMAWASATFTVWTLVHTPDSKAIPQSDRPAITPARSALLAQEPAETSTDTATTERLHDLLTMSRAATRSHFAGIFWIDAAHQHLLPAVIETASDQRVREGAISLHAAFEGGSLPHGPTQQFTHAGLRSWYARGREDTAQILTAHIEDDGILLGLLILERSAERGAFTRADLVSAEQCARLVARQRRDEHAATIAERASHDLQVVALAAEQLSDTLRADDVYRIGEALFRELLADVEVAFFKQCEDKSLTVRWVSDGWLGLERDDRLPPRPTMISVAIQRRHVLPYRSGGESDDPLLFGRPHDRQDLERHLICPLVSGQMAHSAVVLRVRESGVFHRTARERIGLVCNQLAAALSIAQAYETMAQRATHDGMTRLLNHVAFREQSALAIERAQRASRAVSMLILDIDHFKSVNDTWGHAIGDDVIRSVADAIRAEVRRVDIAARYGGEEFAIVLEDTNQTGAYQFAERLRTRIEAQRHTSGDTVFQTTVSIGIACFGDHGDDQQTLVEHADAALYDSKRAGRNRVTVWSPTPRTESKVA